MTIRFFASHLLHWRVLIPVICELIYRHEIIVQTTRPDWLGMPHRAMRTHPQHVLGINKTSLSWVADWISYRSRWRDVRDGIQYSFLPRRADVLVSTTKELGVLRSQSTRSVAIGYQHFPMLVCPQEKPSIKNVPAVFRAPHPFAVRHNFAPLFENARVVGCGFPHLDLVAADPRTSCCIHLSRFPVAMLCHPGMARGCTEDRIVERAIENLRSTHIPILSAHPIPGKGGTVQDLRRQYPGVNVVEGWWPTGAECDIIIALGSSSLYEMWAAGYWQTYILGGTPRSDIFTLFDDLIIPSPEDIPAYLSRDRWTRHPETEAVMAGFLDLHIGESAATAAAVIEGRL